MSQDEERRALLGLACCPTFGPVTIRTLLRAFGSAAELWNASPATLRDRGVDGAFVARFLRARGAVSVDDVLKRCGNYGIRFVTEAERDYPELLRHIPDAPVGLFVRGTLRDGLAVAVVGTRRATSYGRTVTASIVHDMARAGVAVVSGLAFGIDAAAHTAALDAGGYTVAVLASGLDQVYPTAHTGLARRIEANGALISEFPPGMPALRHHFPIRNRIIAASTSGTLIVEAPEKSGALLTARAALDYNRDVFAVPGPVTSAASDGTNALIADGARLVRNAGDVLSFYHVAETAAFPSLRQELSDTERTLLQAIGDDPVSADDLVARSSMETSLVNATLVTLELKGWIRQTDHLHYLRSR